MRLKHYAEMFLGQVFTGSLIYAIYVLPIQLKHFGIVNWSNWVVYLPYYFPFIFCGFAVLLAIAIGQLVDDLPPANNCRNDSSPESF